MHEQAEQWVGSCIERINRESLLWPARVLEIGSRDLNGGVRDIFFSGIDFYWGIDIEPGPGVDEVADARTWKAPQGFDVVVCCEVFEHVHDWPLILRTITDSLVEGGHAILTMAGPGRPTHSGREATKLQKGEFYANIRPRELVFQLASVEEYTDWTLDYLRDPGDLRVFATK